MTRYLIDQEYVVEGDSYDFIDGQLTVWKANDDGGIGYTLVLKAAAGCWKTIERLSEEDK